jgi:hypothetical protein
MSIMNKIFGRESKSTVDALLDQIGLEKDYSSRKKLEASVLELVSSSDSELLRAVLLDQKRSGNARQVAARALGKLRDPSSVGMLKDAIPYLLR